MLAAADALDRFDEVIPGVCLLDESVRTAAQCLYDPIVRHECGAQQDAGTRCVLPDVRDSLDAARVREVDIENQEIGGEFLAGGDGGSGVAFLRHDGVAAFLPGQHRAD